MTKYHVFIIVCSLFLANCKSLKNNNRTSSVTYPQMEIFDINKFNKFKDTMNLGVAEYTLDDGSFIHATKSGKEFSATRNAPESPYSSWYFYYPNLRLRAAGQEFYDIQYGISYQYNDTGEITKQVDEDVGYKFSLNDLINKMWDKYKIDLMKPKRGMSVRRYITFPAKLARYEIRYTASLEAITQRRIVINGTNGHIISDVIIGGPYE